MNNGAFGENFPYTNFHDLNLDWIIEVFKDVKNKYDNLDDVVQEAVNNYIDEHPDYNVADDSLTSAKLNKSNIPFYNVTDYEIMPNTGDVYGAIRDLLAEKVYFTGGIVYFPAGKYTVSDTIFIPENTIFMGEGPDTEIYFDETYTYMGTGLGNAGSNVAIMNMKVSQKSTGTFTSGPQLGCIGFSNSAKRQALEPHHTTNVIREEHTGNYAVINVTFVGMYPLQTEPGTGGFIDNVVYKNITSDGCISIQSNQDTRIENVTIDQVSCDVLRIRDLGSCKNISCKNVITNSVFVLSSDLDCNITCDNITVRSTAKKNTLDDGKMLLAGYVTFNDSVFNEQTGIDLIRSSTGIHVFNNCKFNCPNQKFLSRLETLQDYDSYEVMNNCIIDNSNASATSLLFGYGTTNIIKGTHVRNFLYGDMYEKKSLGAPLSNTMPAILEGNGDRFYLRLNGVVESATLYTFPSTFNLPLDNQVFYVYLWNASTPQNVFISWAKFENGAITITQPGAPISSYNRFILEGDLQLTRTPTVAEVVNSLG